MKRLLLYTLVAVVLGGWVGTLISRDPGYVLISWDGYSMQTSLWVLIGLVIVLMLLGIWSYRLTKAVLVSPERLKDWRSGRRASRANALSQKGFALLAAGEYSRALKFLESGAAHNEYPGANYLAAARAADELDDGERRETFLRLAVEQDRELASAAAITSAEMASRRADWQRCLDELHGLRTTSRVLVLKQQALQGLGDWISLKALIPQMRKAGLQVGELEKQVAIALLDEGNADDASQVRTFKKLKGVVRQDSDVLLKHIDGLSDEAAAETALRQAMKRTPDPSLLQVYAQLGSETLPRRIKQVQAWIRKDESAELHLALANLHRQAGDQYLARESCENSIALAPSQEAHRLMGELLAEAGDVSGSNQHYSKALNP